ncbi:MAG: NifU family protein [Pseudobdellovibrionaceae bacterium]
MNTNSNVSVTFESTPNPATMKFFLHQEVTSEGFDCPTAEEAERSPLASKIFGFPWTSSVYIGKDFITVTKQDWVEWEFLAQPLSNLIQEHLGNNEPVVIEFIATSENDQDDSQLVRNIKSALNREIRPVVALDGGDVLFYKFENNILYVRMKGACSGCPSSTVTLKEGIEVRMKELFPEIQEVVSV